MRERLSGPSAYVCLRGCVVAYVTGNRWDAVMWLASIDTDDDARVERWNAGRHDYSLTPRDVPPSARDRADFAKTRPR